MISGQLGNPASTIKPFVSTPLICGFFPENGLKVCRVSCGTHHTITLAVPVHAVRVFMTHTYTFGWGEHGRLGLGNEDNKVYYTILLSILCAICYVHVTTTLTIYILYYLLRTNYMLLFFYYFLNLFQINLFLLFFSNKNKSQYRL